MTSSCLYILQLLSVLCHISLIECYIYELWSTEQLDDMILSDAFKKSVPARTPAVVALYETECKNKLYQEFKYSNGGLPDSMSLILTAFDRKSAKNIWYDWMPEIMDVFIRYNLSTIDEHNNVIDNSPKSQWCPTVLWQPADWNKPTESFNPSIDGPFKQWVWTHLVVEDITFINNFDKQINLIMKMGDSHDKDIVNEMIVAQIPRKQSITINSQQIGFILHAGDTIHAVDNEDNIINRYVLDTVTKEIEIVQTEKNEFLEDGRYTKYMAHILKLRNNRDWSTRRRYLNNIRTPQHIPTFTETGFKNMAMPKELCDYLQEYHKESIGKKRKEGFPKDGTQINAREISTFMMHIPPDKKMWIGGLLQPMMEEWSGVKLKYSTIYGLREYIKGAVLKTHCDRVETHVVSVILHVHHEPV
eukprot:243197_1